MKAKSSKFYKIIAFLLCFLLCIEQSGLAQIAGQLDMSGHLTALHNSLISDTFRPLHLRYLQYNSLNNSFQLFLDKGSIKNPQTQELENTTKTLLNYFFIGVTLPNESFWVNLRPDAEDQIIDDRLAQTDVGKIMLETDLQLKKDTARFTSPETPEGKEYWDKLYNKAGEIFGSENITIPTLTRPWIVPDEIIIRETVDSAYIYKATLKVMLEQDYLKDSAVYNFKDDRLKELNEYSSQLIRELIIPKLTKEVNSSKRYASLRQVYYSLIMAQWFKARYAGKSGLYSQLIDRKSLTGLTSKESWSKSTYFEEYQKSFKDGEYNIQEPVYTPYGQTIRSYFSGGTDLNLGFGLNLPFGAVSGLSAKGVNLSLGPASGSPIVNNTVVTGFKGESTNEKEKYNVELLPLNPEEGQPSVASSAMEVRIETLRRISDNGFKPDNSYDSLPIRTERRLYRGLQDVSPENVLKFIREGIKKSEDEILEAKEAIKKYLIKAGMPRSELENKSFVELLDIFDKEIEQKNPEKEGFWYKFITANANSVSGWLGSIVIVIMDSFSLSYKEEDLDTFEKLFKTHNGKEVLEDVKKIVKVIESFSERADTAKEFAGLNGGKNQVLIEIDETKIPQNTLVDLQVFSHFGEEEEKALIGNVPQEAITNIWFDGVNIYSTGSPTIEQEQSASSAVEGQKQFASSPAKINKIDDGVVNRKIKAMYGLNAKIKRLLSNILNSTSEEDIERMFVYRGSVMEIGSAKRVFIVPIGVWQRIDYDMPEDSPYRYSSMGAHKDRYMLVDIDEAGKVKKIFIYVEWGGMYDSDRKCFVELSEGLSEIEADKSKLKLIREKIEELVQQIGLKTYNISKHDQLNWGTYIPFGRRSGEIEREIEKSILLKWLLSLPEAEDATVSPEVEILDPRGVSIGGVYLPEYGLVSGGPYSFSHEFAHHIFRNLKPELKAVWISYLKEHEPEFIDRIINFTHRDIPGYERDKMTAGQQEEVSANEYFAFSIGGLNNAGSERSVRIEKLVDLGILPEWMRPSTLGFKKDMLNEDYYLTLAWYLAEQNYVTESLGIAEKVVSQRLIMGPETISKIKGIINGFRKFYGNTATDRLLNELDEVKASSPLNVQSKDSMFGGIDFRSLPIVTQAIGNLSADINPSAIHNLVSINLDEEWGQIERMASSGITPSSERIKEYVQTSCAQENIIQDRDKILLCISDILRLEEERCNHTNPTLRDILVVLESIMNAQELRQVFLGEEI